MVLTSRLRLDRISSSTRNAGLSDEVIIGNEILAEEGFVIAIRILEDKSSYNSMEDLGGRLVRLRAGDVMAGTLGNRRALRGYAGEVPASIAVGDTIDVLNLGGILGHCTSINPEIGPPFKAEVLGAVLAFPELGDRVGRPAHIRDNAITPAEVINEPIPIVFVAGTCMHSGKTVAATELVRGLSRAGKRVGAVKLTGVSLMSDAMSMSDAGAVAELTFNDAGAASTRPGMTVSVARGLLNKLTEPLGARPDVVVAELGDGILGEYGVQDILAAPDLTELAAAWVVAAPDPVGCWGAHQLMSGEYGLTISVLTGPATDNDVGSDYISAKLGLPAHNARRDSAGLVACVEQALARWQSARRDV
jgi:hypothetical protein